jgi:hypothetical protein
MAFPCRGFPTLSKEIKIKNKKFPYMVTLDRSRVTKYSRQGFTGIKRAGQTFEGAGKGLGFIPQGQVRTAILGGGSRHKIINNTQF